MGVDKKNETIKYLQNNGGIAKFSAIRDAGFHSDTIYSLEKNGKIEKVSHGIYKITKNDLGSQPELVIVSMQVPKGVICLQSALYFHRATVEIPNKVSIAIVQGAHANRIQYPPIKFYRFAKASFEAGIEEHKIGRHNVKVYCLAKTVADCFKFRNKIGVDVAIEALKIAVLEKHIKPIEIMQYAKVCRVDNIIKPILEVIL